MTPSTVIAPRVLVTGANGFIGRHLRRTLSARGFDHRGAVRALRAATAATAATVGDDGDVGDGGDDPHTCVVGDLQSSTDWSSALEGVDVVVHLAARAHVMAETAVNPEAEFMRVNAAGTAALVAAAVAAGVRRFVYVSSIGVLGSHSADTPFNAASMPRPHNAYTRSKLAGELAARAAAARLEVVILRLPLVYGPGVRANFLRLLRWIDQGRPLPLGAVHNRRSLLNVWNLCDLIVNVVLNPAAPGGTWLVSDGEDVSTPELIRLIGAAMGRRVRLLAVPVVWLQWMGRLAGRQALITQLCGTLSLDIARTRDQLRWAPPVSVEEALARTVSWYLAAASSLEL